MGFSIKQTIQRIIIIFLFGFSFCLGCETADILSGLGLATGVGGIVIPKIVEGRGQVKSKDILAKMDLAFQEYDAQVSTIIANEKLSPKERKELIKEKTKVLNQRVAAYKGLLAETYGFTGELLDYLSAPEGQEQLGQLSSLLPGPYGELAMGGANVTLLVLMIMGYRGRSGFKNIGTLLGKMIENFKDSKVLSSDQVKTMAETTAGELKVSTTDLHKFLKRYNIS